MNIVAQNLYTTERFKRLTVWTGLPQLRTGICGEQRQHADVWQVTLTNDVSEIQALSDTRRRPELYDSPLRAVEYRLASGGKSSDLQKGVTFSRVSRTRVVHALRDCRPCLCWGSCCSVGQYWHYVHQFWQNLHGRCEAVRRPSRKYERHCTVTVAVPPERVLPAQM
jgi:hypothetical protein